MHDNWLIALSMVVSSLGIAGLLFALIILELPLSSIPEAGAAADGSPVRLRGEVVSLQQRGTLSIITMRQEVTLDLVLFSNQSLGTIAEGDCIIASGKKGSYNGAAQISPTRLMRC